MACRSLDLAGEMAAAPPREAQGGGARISATYEVPPAVIADAIARHIVALRPTDSPSASTGAGYIGYRRPVARRRSDYLGLAIDRLRRREHRKYTVVATALPVQVERLHGVFLLHGYYPIFRWRTPHVAHCVGWYGRRSVELDAGAPATILRA